MSFRSLLGRLRALGATEMDREASVLVQLLRRHDLEEVELAIDGLQVIFPNRPVSLRMINGRAMIGGVRGWYAATNAAIKAQEVR